MGVEGEGSLIDLLHATSRPSLPDLLEEAGQRAGVGEEERKDVVLRRELWALGQLVLEGRNGL